MNGQLDKLLFPLGGGGRRAGACRKHDLAYLAENGQLRDSSACPARTSSYGHARGRRRGQKHRMLSGPRRLVPGCRTCRADAFKASANGEATWSPTPCIAATTTACVIAPHRRSGVRPRSSVVVRRAERGSGRGKHRRGPAGDRRSTGRLRLRRTPRLSAQRPASASRVDGARGRAGAHRRASCIRPPPSASRLVRRKAVLLERGTPPRSRMADVFKSPARWYRTFDRDRRRTRATAGCGPTPRRIANAATVGLIPSSFPRRTP